MDQGDFVVYGSDIPFSCAMDFKVGLNTGTRGERKRERKREREKEREKERESPTTTSGQFMQIASSLPYWVGKPS